MIKKDIDYMSEKNLEELKSMIKDLTGIQATTVHKTMKVPCIIIDEYHSRPAMFGEGKEKGEFYQVKVDVFHQKKVEIQQIRDKLKKAFREKYCDNDYEEYFDSVAKAYRLQFLFSVLEM